MCLYNKGISKCTKWHHKLPDSKPSPRGSILSAKGVFLSAKASPRSSSWRRPPDAILPAKPSSPRAGRTPLGGHVPRGPPTSQRIDFYNNTNPRQRAPTTAATTTTHHRNRRMQHYHHRPPLPPPPPLEPPATAPPSTTTRPPPPPPVADSERPMRERDRGVGKGGELGTSSKGSQPRRGAALGEDGRRARGAMPEVPRSRRLHISTGEATPATYEGEFGGAGMRQHREGGHTEIEAHCGWMHRHHTFPHHCSPPRGEGRVKGEGAARLCRRCEPGVEDRGREREEGGMLAD
jgi:hypothetical protein